ncbi:MAG TPA: glycosyltransferase family 2 protein [Patescibacteria group bacterium]|nr:glycosyltransferase family 2 protein [Patescibacteria group bacterium]
MARTVFWISLVFVCYTYLFYPLLVVFASRVSRLIRHHARMRDGGWDSPPSVTLIIVVYNEEKRIEAKLRNCRELDYPGELLTVCFVSDGSTDGTNAILEKQDGLLFIRDGRNLGKPSRLNDALERCTSEIVVFSDVRQMYREDAIKRLVEDFDDPAVGAVSGELVFRDPRDDTERSIGLYWTYEKIIRRAESDIDSTLGATGAIYAVRRDLVGPIPPDTVLDDIEFPLQAFKKGYRVIFEPGAVAYDAAVSEIGREFGRKTRTLAGNFQLFSRNPWLFNPFRNRIFLQTISHKFFRLLVPYALIVLLASSLLQGGIAYRVFFASQVLAYLLGCAALLSAAIRRIRPANLASVFISLNAASVVALHMFVFHRIDVRWKR